MGHTKPNKMMQRRTERLKNPPPKLRIRIWSREELDINAAVQAYETVLRDTARYAESQKEEEVSHQKRKARTPDGLQPSGLAGRGRSD